VKKIPVGIQLYSVRTEMPKDVAGNLKKLAKMGYQGVEFAGYYDLKPDVLRKMLDDAGLKCAGAHTGLNTLEGDAFEKTVAMNKALGTDRMIIPHADMKDYANVIKRINAIYTRAKAAGMRLGFHNHTGEFALLDGKTYFDLIFEQTPQDFLAQIDIGWAFAAKQDVPALLRKYAKRIETVHVKEFKTNDRKAPVGEGEVKWPPIFDLMEKETSVQWYIVEQEDYMIGPMESAQACIDNIRKMGR
jgi:sugar phosphate isomerase/epimerase